MNNEQFRRLAFGSGTASSAKKDAANNAASSSANGSGSTPSAAPAILGSRQKASIPMTPRVGGGGGISRVAFAKQMAERFGQDPAKKRQPQKKTRLSVPKGSRFAAGYVDRAKLRAEHENDEDAATVPKGLDFDLLKRVRNGEDVLGEGDKKAEADDNDEKGENDEEEPGADVDDEFEQLEKTTVQAVEKNKAKKKGQYSTTAAVAGRKRTRDQILAEMKAAREAARAAKAAAEPALGSRFKKIGASTTGLVPGSSRIERDSRGREVLVIVDEDGHEKRKVRKVAAEAEPAEKTTVDEPKPSGEVLGMEVPEYYRKKLEAEAAAEAEKEVNIFDDVESDYDPLAAMSGSDSESGEEEENRKAGKREERRPSDREDGEASDSSHSQTKDAKSRPSDAKDQPPTQPPRRSYFGSEKLLSEETRSGPSANDPSVLAALRKAKQLREAAEAEEKQAALSKEEEREARLKKLLENSERDAADLDLEFSVTRGGVEVEEEGEGKGRVSKWKGKASYDDGDDGDDDDDDGDDGGGGRGGQPKRKRGGKKRKGDVNSAEDVLRVLESRKGGAKS